MIGGLAKTILVLGLAVALVHFNLGFHLRAEVKPVAFVRVFFDKAQTQELKQGATFNWGKISSGVWTLTLYVNNTGNDDAILDFKYHGHQLPENWMEYWDYDGTPLAHNELRKVTITLVVPEGLDAGVYEWNSWITATPA